MKGEHLYLWQGVSINGERQQGELHARHRQQVIASCKKSGVVVTKVSRVYDTSFFTLQRVTQSDILFLIVQLKTMLQSGVPLLECLGMLREVSKKRQLRDMLADIIRRMRSGTPLSQALSYYPQDFSALFISLVEVGEQTGRLDQTLEQLLTYQQIDAQLKQRVRRALTYPCVVLLATILICGGLLIFVVPRFVHIFSSMQANLPPLTQQIVSLSHWFSHYWQHSLWLILGLVLGVRFIKRYSDTASRLSARLLLATPVLGSILHLALLVRYCTTLATLLEAGISITQACRRAAVVTDNAHMMHVLRDVPSEIAAGHSLSQSLQRINLIPHLMCQMMRVGEESGELVAMLRHISQHYLSVLTASVEQLGQLLEPIFLFILGGLVGLLVIALYLPIFDLMTVMR